MKNVKMEIKQGQKVRVGEFLSRHVKDSGKYGVHAMGASTGIPCALVDTAGPNNSPKPKMANFQHEITYLGDGLWQI